MRTSICVGYRGHECKKIVPASIGNYKKKRCFECAIEHNRLVSRSWGKRNVEHVSVRTHHYRIVKATEELNRTYKNMPFFDGWNPRKGGSYKIGTDWVIKNLGKRPEGCSLHIIDHEKGFVPENLEWASPRKQSNQQMFIIIAQQRHRIKELEAEIERLKAGIQ